MLLEPDQEATWPPGLPQEDDGNIAVTVENVRNIDMTLACRTTLGWLHSVDASYPLEAKPMESQEPELFHSGVAPPMQQPSQTA